MPKLKIKKTLIYQKSQSQRKKIIQFSLTLKTTDKKSQSHRQKKLYVLNFQSRLSKIPKVTKSQEKEHRFYSNTENK